MALGRCLGRWFFAVSATAWLAMPSLGDSPRRMRTDDEAPPRVIFLLADGMGVGMLSSANDLREGTEPLAIESMPVVGLIKTRSLTGAVTDSAAGATAYATGHKVENAALAMTPGGVPIRSITDGARERGLAIGLITTTDLTDASPAAFVVSVPSRNAHAAIFEEMVRFGADLMVGGLASASIQRDRIDPELLEGRPVPISESLTKLAEQGGYLLLNGDDEILDGLGSHPGERVLGIASRRELDGSYGPDLGQTVRRALDHLVRDPEGFFLFIEQEETDTGGHANQTDRVVEGVLEIDRALRAALDFQREHPETLVVLTADHDTGALSVGPSDYESGELYVRWVSKDHTSHWVPIFASGPGAQAFTGVKDNTQIAPLLAEALEIGGIPAPLPASAFERPARSNRRGIGAPGGR